MSAEKTSVQNPERAAFEAIPLVSLHRPVLPEEGDRPPAIEARSKEALAEIFPSGQSPMELADEFRLTILSAHATYSAFWARSKNSPKSTLRKIRIMNEVTRQYQREVNQCNPEITLQLGVLCVLGNIPRVNKRIKGRFTIAAAILRGETYDLIKKERVDYVTNLLPPDMPETEQVRGKYTSNIRPHISLGFVDGYEKAEEIKDHLNETGRLRGTELTLGPVTGRPITPRRS